MNKKQVRLTESQLLSVVKNVVSKIVNRSNLINEGCNFDINDVESISYCYDDDEQCFEIEDCMNDEQEWMNVYPGYMTDDEIEAVFGRETLNSMKRGEGSRLNDTYKRLYVCVEKIYPDINDLEGINAFLKKKVGQTNNWSICGWILTDGTMLPYTLGYGKRDIDHNQYVTLIDGLNTETFMDKGAIRCFPYGDENYIAFEIKRMPTSEQFSVIRNIIGQVGNVVLDLRNGREWRYYSTSKLGFSDAKLISKDEIIKSIKTFFSGSNRSYDSELARFL